MATGVLFNKAYLLQPGAYTSVDASGLATSPSFAFGTVCVLGAGLGGAPMTPYVFNDPAQAQALFGAGTPLSEAIRFAFMGGANGGATTVVGVRIDNCGQAYGTLTDANSGTELTASFKDYGAYGNTYSVSFYPASVAGTMAIVSGKYIDGRTYSQKWDNETNFGRLIERINNESPIAISVTAGGTKATQTINLATSQVDGRATITDSQAVARGNQAYIYQYPAVMLENTSDSMLVSVATTASWAIGSVNTTSDVWTTSATHTLVAGNYVRFTGTTLPPEISTTSRYVIRATASNTTFEVSEVISSTAVAISALNTGSNLLTAPGHTLVNGDIVQIDGTTIPTGLSKGQNYFVVGVAGNDFQVAATSGGTAIVMTGTVASASVKKIAGGTTVNITGSVSGASVHLDLGQANISASNPTDFNGRRETAKVIPAYTQSVTSLSISAAAYSSDSARFTLSGAEKWGHVTGKGLPGSIFTIASGIYQGTYQVLHYEWNGLSTDNVRICRKLSGDRVIPVGTFTGSLVFQVSYLYPRLQPSTNALESRIPANGLLATGGQYLTVVVGDATVYYNTLLGDTIESLGTTIASLINTSPDMKVTASAAYNAGTYTATITLLADTPGTTANSYAVNVLVNAQNTLLVASGGTRLTGGVDPFPPRNTLGVTSGAVILSNGFDSSPTYQRWLDGLNTIKFSSVRYIVPAGTDNLGVQLACADHVTLMSSTPQRRERMTILGHGAGWSKEEVKARSEVFQSERVVFVSPGIYTSDDVTGSQKFYPAYYTAALIAGALAAEGNGVSDPITHTYIRNVTKLEFAWQPGSNELDAAIESGVLTIERDPALTRSSRGFRVTRGITTYRVTGISAFKSNALQSISIVNQADFAAARIRTMEEDLFIGTALLPDTLELLRTAINAELSTLARGKFLYGFDPAFTQVTINPNYSGAVDAVMRIYPAPALEFVLNEILLQKIPSEEATA